MPYYFSPNQEFDVLWLGASPKAKTLGRIQDSWLATGSKAQEAFNDVISCDGHGSFSALQIKQPPERDDPSQIVVTFSDCSTSEGSTFNDLYDPLIEWGKYIGEHGSPLFLVLLSCRRDSVDPVHDQRDDDETCDAAHSHGLGNGEHVRVGAHNDGYSHQNTHERFSGD